MQDHRRARRTVLTGTLAALLALAAPFAAQAAPDKMTIGVFPLASSLPYFVAADKGMFKDENLDVEMVRLIGGPPNIAALIQNQIDAATNLVTIEGLNADLKKPGVVMYISLNTQNAKYQMEQFVVRKGVEAHSLADLKGKRILSAPGPANVTMAKAALAAAGLKEGDYQMEQLDPAQHVGALAAGTFDAGYTLEPAGAVMRKMGVASTLEAGIIAHYVLGDPNANAWVAGCAVSTDFLTKRPEVAKRFAAAWAKAIAFIGSNPAEARQELLKNALVPPDVADTVPLVRFAMVSELTPKDMQDFQTFIDFSAKIGTLPEKVDVTRFVKRF